MFDELRMNKRTPKALGHFAGALTFGRRRLCSGLRFCTSGSSWLLSAFFPGLIYGGILFTSVSKFGFQYCFNQDLEPANHFFISLPYTRSKSISGYTFSKYVPICFGIRLLHRRSASLLAFIALNISTRFTLSRTV